MFLLFAYAGMSFAIAAAFTVRLLVMGADALTVGFLVGVVTP